MHQPSVDGHRWVELFPPDSLAGIALAPATAATAGVSTGLIVTCDDVDATHSDLRAKGLDVDAVVAHTGSSVSIRLGVAEVVGPIPSMFHVRDPDGNESLVIQDETVFSAGSGYRAVRPRSITSAARARFPAHDTALARRSSRSWDRRLMGRAPLDLLPLEAQIDLGAGRVGVRRALGRAPSVLGLAIMQKSWGSP